MTKKGLHVQNRLEGCILQRSSTQRFTKLSTVSLGRKLVRVPVPMLWFGTSSHNIQKNIKDSSLSFETSDDNSHNSSQRFIDFRKKYERNIYGKGLCHLPIATSRVCDISEEACVRSCTRNRVLRVDSEFPHYEFVITKRKVSEDKKSMPEFLRSIRGTISGFDKTNRNTFFNPARLQSRFLQEQQILCLKQTQSYLTMVKLTPMAKNEVLWWVNNPELYNGGLVIQPQTQFRIQTDASKKGWRAVC